ncbi:hypothetical protein [Methyloglobulus sp.]|uniref:hypothetical protein n=1 Tax=Methyloglobulus sp. TaxID=2518622 RepID=UPI00398933F2
MASCDTAELLDPAKEPFYQITVLILVSVKVPLPYAVGLQRDNCRCAAVGKQFVGIVGLVRNDSPDNHILQQANGLGHVVDLPARNFSSGDN